jgi:signal peptidase II
MTRSIAIRLALIFVLGTTIGCDRATKHVAATALAGAPIQSFLAGTVQLQYAENAGGFLSVGANLPPAARTAVFTIGTGLVLIALVATGIRMRVSGWRLVGLTLFLAGGASNWFDRATRGSVVDFISVGLGPLRTGIFNVADVAILLGVTLVMIEEVRRHRAEPLPADVGSGHES